MKATSATIALLVVLAPLLGGASAVAGLPAGDFAGQVVGAAAPAIGGVTQVDNGSNASLGSSISSFMQASEADAESGVDNGMFDAAFEQANESERARLVTDRTMTLDERLEALRQERQELLTGANGGNISGPERSAQVARLTARIQGLERAIDRTEVAAQRAGVEASRLDVLRLEARNMTGPGVADVNTGLRDIDRRNQSAASDDDDAKGPPEDGPGNERAGANESDGGSADDPGGGAGDGSDAGNENGGANGSDTADGSDRGSGTDGGDGSDRGDGNDDDNGGPPGNGYPFQLW